MYIKLILNHSALLYLPSGKYHDPTHIWRQHYANHTPLLYRIVSYPILSHLIACIPSLSYGILLPQPLLLPLLHSTPLHPTPTLLYPLCSALHRKLLHRTLHDYTILRTRLHDGILPFDSTFPHRFVSVLVDVFVMYGLSVLVTHVNIN